MNKFVAFSIILLFLFVVGSLNDSQQTMNLTKENIYKGMEMVSLLPILMFGFVIILILAALSQGIDVDMQNIFLILVSVGALALVIGLIMMMITSI